MSQPPNNMLAKKYEYTGTKNTTAIFMPQKGKHLVAITDATFLETPPTEYSYGKTGCNIALEVQDTEGNTFILQRVLNIKDTYNDGSRKADSFEKGVKHTLIESLMGDHSKDSYISLITNLPSIIGKYIIVDVNIGESKAGNKYIEIIEFTQLTEGLEQADDIVSSGLLEKLVRTEIYTQHDFSKESFNQVLYSSCFPKTNPEFVFLLPFDPTDDNKIKLDEKDRYAIFRSVGEEANEFYAAYIKTLTAKPNKIGFRFGYIKLEKDTEAELKKANTIAEVYHKAGFTPISVEQIVAMSELPTYDEQKTRLTELVAKHSPMLK